jgi:hypothetical protein
LLYNGLEEKGCYYYNARWYDAGTGRFISEDPARDGANWYVYVSNNPLKYIDPTGLAVMDDYDYQQKSGMTQDERDAYDGKDNNGNDGGGGSEPSGNDKPEKKWYEKGIWKKWSDVNREAKIREQQWQLNRALKMTGATEQDLKDLINIQNLGSILTDPNNRLELDEQTKKWMNGMSQDALEEKVIAILGSIKVLSGGDVMKSNMIGILSAIPGLGFSPGKDTAMVGIAGTIYNFTGVLSNNNMDMITAALLGHETIHSLQSAAHVGLANYLDHYSDNDPKESYGAGLNESTAYNFGGSARYYKGVGTQVLKRNQYQGWFK